MTETGDTGSPEVPDVGVPTDAGGQTGGGATPGRDTVPGRDTEPDELPQLVDDRLIEAVIRGAKVLVIVVYIGSVVTFTMLTLGFLLRLFGASPEAPFVEWVYRSTGQAMKPFRGMFPVSEIDGRSVFDPSLLFAAALYGFVAIGLHAVVDYLTAWARLHHGRAERARTGQSEAG